MRKSQSKELGKLSTRRDARGEPCCQTTMGKREGSVALTRRQAEVLELALEGKGVRHIAAELFVSESTVATHLRTLRQRFGVGNRMALCRAALMQGQIRMDEGTAVESASLRIGGDAPCHP